VIEHFFAVHKRQ